MEEEILNEEEKNEYFEGIWAGLITVSSLYYPLYVRTGNTLLTASASTFLPQDLVWPNPRLGLWEDFSENIYRFSAAKQYQEVRILSGMVNRLQDGSVGAFKEFKDVANVIFKEFNVNYLRTEVTTATATGQMAVDFVGYEENKEDFPLLRYETQRDGRVRDEHARLDKIIKPVGDPFWDTHLPPNGWNCRCFVSPLSEGKVTGDRRIKNLPDDTVSKEFKFNPAKSGMVFHEKKHPYFKVAKGHKALKENNFNMPLPREEEVLG